MDNTRISKGLPMSVNADLLNMYTHAGMTLFPCSGFTKKPAVKGFLGLSHTPYLEIQNNNYGVLLNEKYLVIDIDPRHFKPATDKPFARLCHDIGLTPKEVKDTFVVKSPRGGFHLYYTQPESVQTRGSLKNYPGLEFKTKFIMAAGSYSEEQDRQYTILTHSPHKIAHLPDPLLALLVRPEVIDIVEEGLTTDHPTNTARFVNFVATVPPAVQGQGGDNATYHAAAVAKDLGLSWTKAYELMLEHYNPRCQPPWSEDDLKAKVMNAYEFSTNPLGVDSIENQFDELTPDDTVSTQVKDPKAPKFLWDVTGSGTLKNTSNNCIALLTMYPDSLLRDMLRFNMFSNQIEFKRPPKRWFHQTGVWTDDDAIQVKAWLSRHNHYDPPVTTIHEAAASIAFQEAYHPVRDYLSSLQWDGEYRLDTWLNHYCGAQPNVYTTFVGRKMLIGAVARVFKPGVKFDHALILEGPQGIGKSMVCRILAKKPEWFTDANLDVRDKSSIELIQGKWIIELAEMDVLSKYESKALKGFITRERDNCRPAYARATKPFPRQCVFMGTINPEADGYLRDPTGNRRWWPVAIKRCRFDALTADVDQIWAEAVRAFKGSEKIHVEDASMLKIMRAQVETRQQEDPWLALIDVWLEKKSLDYYEPDYKEVWINPADIFISCIGSNPSMFSNKEAQRIGTVLKRLGFSKRPVEKNGTTRTMYIKRIDKIL